jgi:hypothetical protein
VAGHFEGIDMTSTREQWLTELVRRLAPDFAKIDKPLQVELIRVSVGFPSKRALSRKNQRISECWSTKASKAGHHEIYISPVMGEVLDVAATLTHELVHSAVGTDAGHKGSFRRVALAIGLEGKMTATIAGDALKDRLNALCDKIGAYPHSQLNPALSGIKKQGTRMLKASCPACGYTVRLTKKWADEGLPTCVCGDEMTLDD